MTPSRLIIRLVTMPPLRALVRQLLFRHGEFVVGVAEEDQPQHRDGIFRRLQLGVGPQLVGSVPQPPFDSL